jgi:hypothetical protein
MVYQCNDGSYVICPIAITYENKSFEDETAEVALDEESNLPEHTYQSHHTKLALNSNEPESKYKSFILSIRIFE